MKKYHHNPTLGVKSGNNRLHPQKPRLAGVKGGGEGGVHYSVCGGEEVP